MKKKIIITSVAILIIVIVAYGLFKKSSVPYYMETPIIHTIKDATIFPADVITGHVKGDENQIRSKTGEVAINNKNLRNHQEETFDEAIGLVQKNDPIDNFDSQITPPPLDKKTLRQLELENKKDVQGDITENESKINHKKRSSRKRKYNPPKILKSSKVLPTISRTPPIKNINTKGIKEIAILIDSMGTNALITKEISEMKYNLNLSFIPYLRHVKSQVAYAKKLNKSIVMQIPMQPLNSKLNLNEHTLLISDSQEQLLQKISWNLSQFQGYSAVMTYMGSRFVQNESKLHIFMSELKKRDVHFVDALNSIKSKAYKVAIAHKILTLKRDVFINDRRSYNQTLKDFSKVTYMANKQGYTLAIVHPTKITIRALKVWLEKISANKNYKLVTIDQLINHLY